MDTNGTWTKMRAAVIGATAGVSAVALLGAGVAHAEAQPVTFTNEANTLQVIYGGGGLALNATIVDATNPPGVTEVCHYRQIGVLGTPAFPYDADAWVTGPNPSAAMTLMIWQTGGKYSVTVTCYGTGNTASYSPVIY